VSPRGRCFLFDDCFDLGVFILINNIKGRFIAKKKVF
jgi:hypothetical protein